MPVTLKQIAKHSGVSRISVVRALHGQGKVGAETRQRILDAARELGYGEHSNHEARMLAARRHGREWRHGTLAVIGSQMFQAEAAMELPFYAQLFRGMEEGARQHGTEICLLPMKDEELPQLIRARNVDGVICISALGERIHYLRDLRLPCVTVGLDAVAAGSEVGLLPDGYRGIYLATCHLLALGHRRLGCLSSPPADPLSKDRLRGFQDALHDHGVPLFPEYVEEVDGQVRAGTHLSRILERDTHYRSCGRPGFTGLVCHNDIMAMAAVRRLVELGLQVPQDVSVTGFDDLSVQYSFAPALTSVSFDREAMGRRAVELLCSSDLQPGDGPNQELFPVKLMARDSTAAIKKERLL